MCLISGVPTGSVHATYERLCTLLSPDRAVLMFLHTREAKRQRHEARQPIWEGAWSRSIEWTI